MKKKVCFVQLKALAYFMPELDITPGGAERQIYLLSTHLAKDPNWEVSICVADHGQEACLEREGVKLQRSISSNRNRVLELPKLYRCLKAIDADVYVFRTVDLGVAVGAFLVKTLGKKMVYMVANVDEANPKALKSWFGAFRSAAMAWVYHNVDALVVQTEEQGRDFKVHRHLEVQARIPNLYVSQGEAEEATERDVILWVGRCDPLKRPHLFIELAQRFSQHAFVLVSPATSYEEYSHEIETKSKSVSNLTLLGRQSQSELSGWYRRAKLLINTSVSEGFSNAMLEALYFEVPMLTMGVDPDGILEQYELGYAEKDEPQFEKNFEKLLDDEALRESMGKHGRDYVEQEHHPEKAMQKFRSVIEQLC